MLSALPIEKPPAALTLLAPLLEQGQTQDEAHAEGDGHEGQPEIPAGVENKPARGDVAANGDEEERQQSDDGRRDGGFAQSLRDRKPHDGLGREGRLAGGGIPLVFELALGADRRGGGNVGCRCHGDQTFSTSGRPSRPEGRKISVIARIENAATSLYSTEK